MYFLQEDERRAELMARAKPREQHWQWDEDTDEGRLLPPTNGLCSTSEQAHSCSECESTALHCTALTRPTRQKQQHIT